MAVKAPVREIGRRIGSAIRKYSLSQGLRREDYQVVGALDENTEMISLFYHTDCQIDGQIFYSGILETIRKEFPESPYISMHIFLVIAAQQNLEESLSRFYPTENEIDLTEWLERD